MTATAVDTLLAASALAVMAAFCLAVVLHARWRRAHARAGNLESEVEVLRARLAAAPVAGFVLSGANRGAGDGLRALLGADAQPADLDAVRRCFQAPDDQRLAEAADRLERQGEGFDLTLAHVEPGRWLRARGVAGGDGPTVWFDDVAELEAARRAAERRLAVCDGLFEQLPLPVWWRDADLCLSDCNAAYARCVDRPRAQALAEKVELLGQGLGDAGRALAGEALRTGQPRRATHHVVAEGARRLMELIEVPLDGGMLAGVAIDRTREEELSGELHRHIAAHGEVLESLGTAIAIFGPDMRLKFYNGAYVDLWGLEEGFLDGEPHLGDVMEVLRERRRLPEQTDFPAFKRERIQRLRYLLAPEEELMHRPDGSTLKITLSPHPFGGALMTFEDVTDRLTLERNFNTLIAVQRETIDNLYEAVAVFGADGRMALYNQAYAELWELPMKQTGDRPHVRELAESSRHLFAVGDAEWPALKERIVARAGEPDNRDGRIERTDGKVLDWAQVPLPDGQSLFTYIDVSDSIRVERALREQAEALETADRLKSEFIANISYELRTPLNAIVGFAEILEKEFFGKLNGRQRDYAHAIVQSSQRLIGLINDILDLATIEAGYLELERAEIDVPELLANMQTIAHERAHSRGIHLDLHCPEDIGKLLGDGRRLKQALFNLLSNAFNFTPEGGTVTLSARRRGEAMELAVADTGPGIPREEQAHMFQKFVRGQQRKSGAGLGLSLVKSLIELHGGHVEIASEPGQGTRVACILPPAGDGSSADSPAEARPHEP